MKYLSASAGQACQVGICDMRGTTDLRDNPSTDTFPADVKSHRLVCIHSRISNLFQQTQFISLWYTKTCYCMDFCNRRYQHI